MSYQDQSPQIKRVMDDLAIQMFGISVGAALEQGVCVQCKEAALPKCYSDLGRSEYTISGLCESCFDEITRGPVEHEDFIPKG